MAEATKDTTKGAPSVNGDAGKAMPVSAPGVKFFNKTLYNREDPNPDFQGRNAIAIYDEMIADPDVDSALARFTMPLESAEVTIEPPDDTKIGEEQAAWCKKWILCEDHPTDTWGERMEHTLAMFTYGFSAFEKILGPDGDGGQAWVEFSPILPQSVWEFRVDDRGHFDAMLQRAYFPVVGYKEALVPAQKVSLFTFRGRGRNYWGRPLIRSAYKPYWHKHNIEILSGIAFERGSVGFMHVNLPDNATKEQIEDAQNVTTEARGNERGGAVTRGQVKIEIFYPSGTMPDFPGTIRLYAKQIHSVMMSDWEQLGAGESGSRAVGGEKIGYALMAYQSVTKKIEGVWDLAIRQMTDLKYGPQKKYCSLKFQDLSRMSGEQLARFLAPLMAEGVKAITRDPDLEQQIRKSSQLPPISDRDMKIRRQIHEADLDRQLETAKNPPQPPVLGPSGMPVKPGQDGKPPVAAKEAVKPVEAAIQVGPTWRMATATRANGRPHPESFCEFDRMRSFLVSEPLKAWQSAIKWQVEKIATGTARLLVAMSDAELRRGEVDIPRRKVITESLVAPFYAVYVQGRREVLGEIARQRPAEMQSEDEDEDIEVAPAERDWIKTIAGSFVGVMFTSIAARGILEATNVRQAEFPKDQQVSAIAAALRSTLVDDVGAPKPGMLAKLSGAMSTAFITGREEQAAAMKDQIETAFYSAMMDEGTEKCAESGGTCAALDGDEHEPGDTAYTVPNPNCAWPSNCNCANVYVAKQKEEAA